MSSSSGLKAEFAPTLAAALRHARTTMRLSVRELARISGVSAGQISRIESGAVARPSDGTLTALARAFGRPVSGLRVLAGDTDPALLERFLSDWQAHSRDEIDLEDFKKKLASGELAPAVVASICWFMWDLDTSRARLDDQLETDFDADLNEVSDAWPLLTPERRRLVRAFVADQVVLSSDARMSSSRNKYKIDVSLLERLPDEAS